MLIGRAAALGRDLVERAVSMGVDIVGCTSASPFAARGAAEEVAPQSTMPEVQSVVVAGCYTYGADSYHPSSPGVPRGRLGPWTRVSVPASGYIVQVLTAFLQDRGYRALPGHGLPLKAAAVRAGIACYGKNSIVHADGLGSHLELAAVLTDAKLVCGDRPIETSDCPDDCRACMDACPTGALAEPFHLTQDKCICHYLWGAPIPAEHRSKVGDLIFRCGACQQACPRNQQLTPRSQFPFPLQTGDDSPELLPLLRGGERYYEHAVPGFARQAGREAIRRNAAIAAGNIGDPVVVPGLVECLAVEQAETRAAAAWALGRLSGTQARASLRSRLSSEQDEKVRAEIIHALGSS